MKITPLGVNGPYPPPGGACSGYLFENDGGGKVVVDLGAGTLSRLLSIAPIAAIDALILTHLHFDHISDALPLRYALDFEAKKNLLVIAPAEPRGIRALFEGGKMDLMEPKDMSVRGFRLSFIPAAHPVPSFSVAIEADGKRVVYTGDTNENDALELFADRADLLIADAGLLERDYTPRAPHLSAKRCGILARRASVGALGLSHLAPRYAKEEVLSEAAEAYPNAMLIRLSRRRPLTIFAACYAAGGAAQAALSGPLFLCGIMLAASALLFLIFRRRALLFAAAVLFGAMNTGLAMRLPEPVTVRNAAVEGRVLSVRGEGDVYERFVLDRVLIGQERYPYKVDAYAYGGAKIMPGDTVRFTGTLYPPENAGNPGGSDEVMMLWKDGIALRASVSGGSVEVTGVTPYMSFFPRMRGLIGERISALFTESSGLTKALCLGVRDSLPAELKADFRDMGISHLLAISGFNVECIALLLDFLLRRLRVSKRASCCVVLMFFALFVALVGFAPSLLRAALMYAMLRITPLMGRPADGMTRLSAAFLLLAILRPLSLFDYGFVLSFSAVAGLMLFMPICDRFLNDWARGNGEKKSPFKRAAAFLLSMACVSVVAQLATLPAVATYYGAISPWSVAANLIAVPVTTAGLPVSLLAIGVSYINYPLGALIAWVPDRLFMLLTRIMGAMTALPLSKISMPAWPWYLAFLYGAALVLMSRYAEDFRRVRRGAAVAIPALIALSFILRSLVIPGGCTLVFLDAGSADATAVFAEGRVYLMDVGDTDSPSADYLAYLGIGAVEGVFLSHPHKDHAAGLLRVLNQAMVKTLYLPEHWDEVTCDERVRLAVETARERGTLVTYLKAGDEVSLSRNVSLTVLQADESGRSKPDDLSMIALLKYGEGSALFAADLPMDRERLPAPDVDILKVAHHGSANGTGMLFTQSAAPSVAVIPVGYNSYGHPRAEVLDRLGDAGAAIYRTDECGAVTATLKMDGSVLIETYMEAQGA